jgi:transcriptional regulator with XRE-family HTH domain
MGLRETFAENLIRIRREKGLSQEALGLEANVDRSYVSLVERAKFSVSLDKIEQFAAALGVEPSAFFAKPTKKR